MSSNDPLAILRVSKLPELTHRADHLLHSLRNFASSGFDIGGDTRTSQMPWEEIRASAHQLAGVLSTLGFTKSGVLAVELEELVAGTHGPAAGAMKHLIELAEGIVEGLELHG